jgi:hypothetical protein
MDFITDVLNSVIGFLNNNSGAILAITTIVYAIITGRMLYQTKKMRESQTEPQVFINVQPAERARFLKNIVIQNIGPGPAYDLRFKIEPDIILRTGKNLSEINLMKKGFKYLAPNQKLECLITRPVEEPKDGKEVLNEMTVAYRNRANKSYEEKFVLDFTEHYGLLYTNDDPYQGIVEKLDAIHADIRDVTARGMDSRIRFVTCTEDEHNEEVNKFLESRAIAPPQPDSKDK